jgi:hypothetical protein
MNRRDDGSGSRPFGVSYKYAFVFLHKLREAMAVELRGRSVPAVFRTEGAALSFIKARVAKGTVIQADEDASWDALHAQYKVTRINHREAYSEDGACTNMTDTNRH